jgi:hypothetical protein
MLRRMKAHGTNGDNVQDVHDGLIALGLIPRISSGCDSSHTPQAYLTFTRDAWIGTGFAAEDQNQNVERPQHSEDERP